MASSSSFCSLRASLLQGRLIAGNFWISSRLTSKDSGARLLLFCQEVSHALALAAPLSCASGWARVDLRPFTLAFLVLGFAAASVANRLY